MLNILHIMFVLNLLVNKDKKRKLSETLFAEVFNGEHVESGGLKFDVTQIEIADISIEYEKLTAVVPMSIKCKIGSGLLEDEISGNASLIVSIKYHITKDFDIIHHTTIREINWHDDVYIKIANTNLEFNKLTTLLTQHIDAFYSARVDKNIRLLSDVRPYILTILKRSLDRFNIFRQSNLCPELHVKSVWARNFYQMGDCTVLSLWVNGEAAIEDRQSFLPKDFEFLGYADHDLEPVFDIKFSASYETLIPLIKNLIETLDFGGQPAKVKNLTINVTKTHQISLSLSQPIEGSVIITLLPFFDERTQKLTLEDIKVEVKPSSFIYKMATPLVQNLIKSGIYSIFPLALDDFLHHKLLESSSKMDSNNSNIIFQNSKIKQLIFTDKGIISLIQLYDLIIEQELH